MSEYTIRELINQSIQFLFISEKDMVYNALVPLSTDDKQTAEKCLESWDIMFEKQLGSVREISRKLMER